MNCPPFIGLHAELSAHHNLPRSIYDFTNYENVEVADPAFDDVFSEAWTATGFIQYPENRSMSYFEEEKLKSGKFKAVERYSYASTSRVNQGARYGDKIVLDQFADQMRLNTDEDILKSMAENIAVMTLSNNVMQNRGGGTLVCGSPNEVAPDPKLDDYFDVIHRDLACIGCQDSYGPYEKQKATVWAMNALEGEDQVSYSDRSSLFCTTTHFIILFYLLTSFSSQLPSFVNVWHGVSTSISTSERRRIPTTPSPTCIHTTCSPGIALDLTLTS